MDKTHKKLDVWNKGFTLIEVVMVIVLLGIIASVAAMIIYQGARSYGEEEVRKDLTTQGRLAIERMAREIRLIRCTTVGNNCTPTPLNTDITNWTATELRFLNINYEGKGFRWDSVNSRLTLCRDQNSCSGNEDILISNVSNFSFQYFNNVNTELTSGVDPVASIWTIVANLTLARDNQTVNFRIQVHPRKFKW